MKIKRVIGHLAIILAALIVLLGVPFALHFDYFVSGGAVDAVAGASVKLPEVPSGEFVVLINNKLHSGEMDKWADFFTGSAFSIPFDDINCLTASGHVAGIKAAQRKQAELPENQMTVSSIDPTLLASKAEAGMIDVAMISREMADELSLGDEIDGVTLLFVSYTESQESEGEAS